MRLIFGIDTFIAVGFFLHRYAPLHIVMMTIIFLNWQRKPSDCRVWTFIGDGISAPHFHTCGWAVQCCEAFNTEVSLWNNRECFLTACPLLLWPEAVNVWRSLVPCTSQKLLVCYFCLPTEQEVLANLVIPLCLSLQFYDYDWCHNIFQDTQKFPLGMRAKKALYNI